MWQNYRLNFGGLQNTHIFITNIELSWLNCAVQIHEIPLNS